MDHINYTWKSTSNAVVNAEVCTPTVTFAGGSTINGVDMIPVLTKEDGTIKEIEVKKNSTCNRDVTMNLYLELTTFPTELSDSSFKYELYKNSETMAIASGDFSNREQGNTITLLSNQILNTSKDTYTLYIYIDGNVDNPGTMAGKNFLFKLWGSGEGAIYKENVITTSDNPSARLNYLFFVGSTDILPEPLSKEEEERYVNMFLNGDMTARDKLIEHNLRLVVFLAKKYENTKIDLEDLVSIGTIGLIKGVNTYQNDKNIKLATYASRCIDNEILMYLRKTKKKRTEVSFEDSLSFDSEGNELHLEDVLGTDDNIVTKPIEDELDKKLMYKEVSKLGKRDKEIIELRYGLNGKKEMTQKEVANMLGISQSYISRIEKKVIKKLSSIIKL